MSEQPPIPPPTLTSTEIDLYCLECGYNLRGLSGDPRRCPECGHLNPMGELTIPAELIHVQLRKMETSPALCAGAALAFLVGLFFGGMSLLPHYSIAPCCIWPLLVISPVAWIVCAANFQSSCMGKPGWGAALLHYHLYALPLALGVLFPFTLKSYLPDLLSWSTWLKIEPFEPYLLLLVPIIILVAGPLAHRRIKKVIQPLQREVAVEMARRWLRGRLSRPGR